MTALLVSTPRYLLRYETETKQTFIVEDHRTEYYGISWFTGNEDLYLSHSGINNESIITFTDYAMSEKGNISSGQKTSWNFLSLPHQILCLGKSIIATNTGRNCLSVACKDDWSIKQYRYDDANWDRYGVEAKIGSHFNSLFADGTYLYMLASNFNRKSFIIQIEMEKFNKINVIECGSGHMHNVWVQDRSNVLVCDTMSAGLVNIINNTTLWSCPDTDVLTRGLAATQSRVFVGVSALGDRHSRTKGETGLWALSNGNYETSDYHSLGEFGAVHDIRVIQEKDLCHDHGILQLSPQIVGSPIQHYWSEKKLEHVRDKAKTRETWELIGGSPTTSGDGSILSSGDAQCIALIPNVAIRNVRIQAVLDVSDPEAHNVAVIARYMGPDDQNMVAALLVRTSAIESFVGLYQHANGVWSDLCVTTHYGTIIDIDLKLIGNKMELRSKGEIVLCAKLSSCAEVGDRIGVRISKGAVHSLRFTTIEDEAEGSAK